LARDHRAAAGGMNALLNPYVVIALALLAAGLLGGL
jgi:hypothetical protein